MPKADGYVLNYRIKKRRGRLNGRSLRKRLFILSGVILVLIYLFIFGEEGFLSLYLKERDILRLRSEIKSVEGENLFLKKEIEELKKDRLRVTKEAREVLGMVNNGEWLVEFIKKE